MNNGIKKIVAESYTVVGFDIIYTNDDSKKIIEKDGLVSFFTGNLSLIVSGKEVTEKDILSNISLDLDSLFSAFSGDIINPAESQQVTTNQRLGELSEEERQELLEKIEKLEDALEKNTEESEKKDKLIDELSKASEKVSQTLPPAENIKRSSKNKGNNDDVVLPSKKKLLEESSSGSGQGADNSSSDNSSVVAPEPKPEVSPYLDLKVENVITMTGVANYVLADGHIGFSGSSIPGSIIILSIDGETYQTVVRDDSKWSLELPLKKNDGDYDFSIKLQGEDIVVSGSISVDSIAEDISVVWDGAVIDGSVDSRVASNTISGKFEPGAKLLITIGDTSYEAVANLDGQWSIVLPNSLEDGTHAITVIGIDSAGNKSEEKVTIHLDSQTEVPTFSIESESTIIIEENLINIASQSFSLTGEAEPNSSILVTFNGIEYITQTNSSGFWSIPSITVTEDGTFSYKVTATDAIGNKASQSGNIMIDSEYSQLEVRGADIVLNSGDELVVNKSDYNLSGRGEPNSTIDVFINGSLFSISVSNDGLWTFPIEQLNPGTNDIKVFGTDKLGNQDSLHITIVYDNEITNFSLNMEGAINIDEALYITSGQPSFYGTSEPNSVVTILINGAAYKTTVGADGAWSIDITPALMDGKYEATIKVEDVAGNEYFENIEFSVDTTIQPVTSQVTVGDVIIGDGSYVVNNDFRLLGTAEPFSKITIRVKDIEYTTFTNKDGIWSYDFTDIEEGAFSYTVISSDPVGNEAFSSGNVIVDTTIANFSNNMKFSADYASGENGRYTNSKTPTIIGKIYTNEPLKIVLKMGSSLSLTTYTDERGNYSFTIPEGWIVAQHTQYFVFEAYDAAGNKSEFTRPFFFVSAPEIVSMGMVEADNTGNKNDNKTTTTPDLTGKVTMQHGYSASDPSKVTFTMIVNGVKYGSEHFVIKPNGEWTFIFPEGLNKSQIYNAELVVEDFTGNKVTKKYVFEIQEVAGGLAPDSDSGVKLDEITNDESPTLSGTAGKGSKVTLFFEGRYFEVTVGANEVWSFDLGALGYNLDDGIYTYQVIVQTSTDKKYYDGIFEIDKTPPSVTEITLNDLALGDTSETHYFNDGSMMINGIVEKYSIVTLTLSNGRVLTAKADASGAFKFSFDLLDGDYSYQLEIEDVAGNKEPFFGSFVVDTTAPSTTLNVNGEGNLETEDTTPLLSGVTEGFATLKVYINGELIDTIVTNKDGNWSLDAKLEYGNNDIRIEMVDKAGNSSTDKFNVVVEQPEPEPEPEPEPVYTPDYACYGQDDISISLESLDLSTDLY